MTLPSKPAEKPEYARTTGVVSTPDTAKKDLGWANGEKPAPSFMNWIHRFSYLWINYLESITDIVFKETWEAGENLVADEAFVVRDDGGTMKAFKATNANEAGVTNFRGFVKVGATTGQNITGSVLIYDDFTGLTKGDKYYLGSGGVITNVRPTSGYVLEVGLAISATELLIHSYNAAIDVPMLQASHDCFFNRYKYIENKLGASGTILVDKTIEDLYRYSVDSSVPGSTNQKIFAVNGSGGGTLDYFIITGHITAEDSAASLDLASWDVHIIGRSGAFVGLNYNLNTVNRAIIALNINLHALISFNINVIGEDLLDVRANNTHTEIISIRAELEVKVIRRV